MIINKAKILFFSSSLYSLLLSISLFYTFKINYLNSENHLKNYNFYILEKQDISHIFQYFIPILSLIIISLLLLKRIEINNTNINFSINKIAAFVFISWLPFLLAFYPSVGMNDTYYILQSPLGLSNVHPFFYNYFIAIPSKISLKLFNSMTYGLFTSTVIQMIFMSYSIAYTITWLNDKLKNKYITYILILYFAFTPIIANYSIAAIKDTIFSVTLMLWIPFLYDTFVENRSIFSNRFSKFYFCFLSFMTIAMRNNGKYIFVILFTLLLYKCLSERKKLVKYSLIIFTICSLPNFYLSTFKNHPQLFQEAVAIPIQQLARTTTLNGKLNQEQNAYLNNLLSLEKIKKQYDPFSVDPIKWDTNFKREYLQQTKSEFFKVWIIGLKNNQHIYLDAWILQTFACWANKTQPWDNPQSTIWFVLSDEVLKSDKFLVSKISPSSTILPINIAKTMENYMLKNSGFINPGNCFWIIGYIALLLIAKNKYSTIITLAPIFLSWLSLMAAVPLSFAYRYAFMYPLCLPFLVFIPFIQNNKNGDNQ